MTISWTQFHCDEPDFVVRSVPDEQDFPAKRKALRTSKVFSDMFFVCDEDGVVTDPEDARVHLDESASMLILLLRLLHDAHIPEPFLQDKHLSLWPKKLYDPSTIIPFPILPQLMALVDKYELPETMMKSLCIHLLANAPHDPLRVYALAMRYDLPETVAEASQYVAPIASYTEDDINNAGIPSVEAYHKIVRLQAYRVQALQRLVLGEELFPHGYGACPSHEKEANAQWDGTRRDLAWRINSQTDVAGEMEVVVNALSPCPHCKKAGSAAVDMMRYKARKLPRMITHLKPEE